MIRAYTERNNRPMRPAAWTPRHGTRRYWSLVIRCRTRDLVVTIGNGNRR